MALSPEQVSKIDNTLYNIDDIEAEVDESIKNYHGWYPWEEALVDREFPVEVRNEVAKRYIKAGWKFVYHNTSSENGERPGLTCFMLSNDAILHCENDKYHKVTEDNDNMKYIIYQLKDLAKSKYGLRSWNVAKENNFSIHDYEKVYTGSIDVENNCDDSIGSVLEKLFAEFNISHPKDFNGHSLSMSDVIALELNNDNYAYYYCDTVGWKSVTEIVNKG